MEVWNPQSPRGANDLLANYLEKHKDEMTVAWVERMRKSRAVPTDSMTVPEIVDHVPQIFDAVIQALRQHRSDEAMDQIAETSAWHVVIRWQQHYDLHAVLREISLLRTELIYRLQVFQEAHPEFGIAQRLFASTTIHRILDDIACDATDKFLKLSRSKSEPIAGRYDNLLLISDARDQSRTQHDGNAPLRQKGIAG